MILSGQYILKARLYEILRQQNRIGTYGGAHLVKKRQQIVALTSQRVERGIAYWISLERTFCLDNMYLVHLSVQFYVVKIFWTPFIAWGSYVPCTAGYVIGIEVDIAHKITNIQTNTHCAGRSEACDGASVSMGLEYPSLSETCTIHCKNSLIPIKRASEGRYVAGLGKNSGSKNLPIVFNPGNIPGPDLESATSGTPRYLETNC